MATPIEPRPTSVAQALRRAALAGAVCACLGLAGAWLASRGAAPSPADARYGLEAALGAGQLRGFDSSRSPARPGPEAPSAPAAGDSAEQLYRDGLIAYMHRDLDEAVSLLKKAAALEPKDERIKNALARIREEAGSY